MKFKIFKEKNSEDEELTLKLNRENEQVVLECVDSLGKRLDQGTILTMKNNGRIHLNCSIDTTLGLKLDGMCRIVIEK